MPGKGGEMEGGVAQRVELVELRLRTWGSWFSIQCLLKAKAESLRPKPLSELPGSLALGVYGIIRLNPKPEILNPKP